MNLFFSHSLFGSKHIIWLIISIIVILLALLLLRKLELKTVNKLMFFIGLPCEIVKVFYYIIVNEETLGGYLPKTDLPFHLCSIQIIFFAILCFSQSDKIKRILYSFMIPSCLFGGFAALLLPTDSARNGLWLLTLEYFLFHAAIVVFALYLLTSKKIKLEIKDYFNCLKFLGVVGLGAIYLNSILNDGSGKINFMYVVKPPQDNLPILNLDHGWFVYILSYAGVAITCITIIYIKPIIEGIKNLIHKKKREA